MLPHLLRTTASSRSRTSLAPSAAISSTPHCRFTACPRNGCPVTSAAARSNTTKVLPAPHWPDSRPCPTVGISCLISHGLSGRGSASPCAYSGGSFGSACSSGSSSSSSGSSSSSSGSSPGSGVSGLGDTGLGSSSSSGSSSRSSSGSGVSGNAGLISGGSSTRPPDPVLPVQVTAQDDLSLGAASPAPR